jgi:hypothetical protein
MADMIAADEKGVICEYWTIPLHHVSVRFLTELGLVKPINTRIPACSDHWCKLAGECPRRKIFDRRIGIRSSLKSKLTPEGKAAFSNPQAFARALTRHKIVRSIRAALTERPQSVFELHARILQERREDGDLGNSEEESAYRRTDLRGSLELMESLGEVVWDRDSGIVTVAPMMHFAPS